MKLFAKIEHVFTVTGRGCVIVPLGLVFPFSLRKNDSIQLRGPGGQIDTYIAGIGSINAKPDPRRVAIILPAEIVKSDVSAEMEIWAEPSK